MIAEINHLNSIVRIDLSKPLDISVPALSEKNVTVWGNDLPQKKIIKSVIDGDSVNFNRISFSPHSHMTHTECLGHITTHPYSINQILKRFFFLAELITIHPKVSGDDTVITKSLLENLLKDKTIEALIIRTTPNTASKKQKNYTNTNWTYFEKEAIDFLVEKNITHLLVDTPSIDKEQDDGKLLGHHAFWRMYGNDSQRQLATITECIFVPNHIKDGVYVLNLQVAPFENNASPSRPILYEVEALSF